MNKPLWKMGAVDLAAAIRRGDASALEATTSVLERIANANPHVNAIVDLMADEALAAARAADDARARGEAPGPLHGVPITVKVNVDTAGHATTDGIVAAKDNVAQTDSPLVASLRRAGAIIVGRTNTPAFSLRWFTDNDLHGRTLNPFDRKVTPGGSSGGAAAAVALGMGAIGHGNDYGGSIRHPAWACGVVGLRTTAGRVPAYKATMPDRTITNQLMSVQGPLTRNVADARVALEVMAQGSPLDPNWVPAPLDYAKADRPLRVALFKRPAQGDVDPTVVAALEQAARWLADAGCEVEEVAPPCFEEASALWRTLVMDDLRRGGLPAVEAMADQATRTALRFYLEGIEGSDRDRYLNGLTRRLSIAREWAVFFERYPVLLTANSWERQFPIDDDQRSQQRVEQILAAQAPLLSTAMLGLPGLAVPTGMAAGLPVGVQLISGRFREDLILRAGALVERAANFSALDVLTGAH